MQSIRIVAIPTEIVREVRLTLRAPVYGFPAHRELATDAAPCRHCLRTFKVGEDYRILFTYDRFRGVESLPQPGPVYIHADHAHATAKMADFRRSFAEARARLRRTLPDGSFSGRHT